MNVAAQLQQAKSLHQSGRLDDAERLYQDVLRTQPTHPDALHFLGLLKSQRGNLDEAVSLMQQAIAQSSDVSMYLNNLGDVLNKSRRFDEALAAYARALKLNPNQPHVYYNIGLVLLNQWKRTEAIASFHKAITLNPKFAAAHRALGEQLVKKGDWEQGKKFLHRALDLAPQHIPTLLTVAASLIEMGQPVESIAVAQRALSLDPNSADSLSVLGQAQRLAVQLDQAEQSFRKAIALQPNSASHHSNLAGVLTDMGRLDEAAPEHETALRLNPQDPSYPWNRSLTLLMAGQYEQGWRDFDALRRLPDTPWRRKFDRPRLERMEDLPGKTVVMHAEYGFGDTIQFVRYANLFAEHGARVIVDCQPQLVRLIQTMQGVHQVISDNDALPNYDFHCPMLWAPAVAQTTMATIPKNVPYLYADAELVQKWQEQLTTETRPKVGIIWSGNPKQGNNINRSVPTEMINQISTDAVALYSVQKGLNVPAPDAFVDLGPRIHDFADTAAIMQALDLVISVCTSTTHLAGALARPTWTLLTYAADFRWLKGCVDNAWYPTMRLIRQPRPHDWTSVLAGVKRELEQWALKRQR
ncbi:MAG TPA: tetratricopeptide repeat protein [Tepidisphaeraceae bacterium]|jgi:tetratricopeptide (TPR) repeat protein